MITVNLSFYNQDDILIKHVKMWKSYPSNIKNLFTFYIIDDCSNNNALEILKNIDLSDLNICIYRVQDDLICNISGVRNLGAKECLTEWMMILDMDTLISQKMAEELVDLVKNNEGSNVYKFNRYVLNNDKHKKNNKIHPAVCLIKKKIIGI